VKAAIQQRARELGFDDCRVAPAAPPGTGSHFQRWLAEQRHGEMAYLERNSNKRVDPQKVLPGAQSIISLSVAYAGQTPRPPAPPSSGLVARYARFADYHHVIGEKLRSLAAFVDEFGSQGTRSLWYVDTGPFLERDLAQRAGLGFIGKHTNLISRRLGNWIFLSEIITTLPLVADEPEKNRCGSCTRCLDACPTNAITAPFQLDARKCISYLTIELKGPIPVELRPAIGNRIYGCDDCLAVCPWNRFAQDGAMMAAHARADLAAPDLLELLALDEPAFKRRFAGTPILRAKRRGLLRNVCVALGNTGDASALPALDHAARDPEPLIAEHARWAVEQISARTLKN
jgi:epoxyqueuosine reductase